MPTTLSPGDLAITGINADDPDAFSFVLLTDIEAGTEIFFTDNGVLSDGSFRQNEGILKYTAPTDIAAGTPIEFIGVGGDFTAEAGAFALAAAGDQVIAYQGTVDNPTFIYAAQTNSTEFQTGSNDSNQSDLPPGLTVGTTAVATGNGSGAEDEFDNATYNESVTSGTQAELLAAISDAANWNGSNDRIANLAEGPFTVTNGGGSTAPGIQLNELRISSSVASDDNSNFVEITGNSGTSLDGVSLVVLSGEFEPGQVDFAFDLSGTTIDEDGFVLLRNETLVDEIAQAVVEDNDVVADFDFFGSPSTFLLVENFTGTAGDDLDADNDGTLDEIPWDAVIDSVSLIDGDGTPDQSYGSVEVGPDGNNSPAGVARDPDGTGDFQQLAFSDLLGDTPGDSNEVIVPPTITPIYEIQGESHVSSFVLEAGQTVNEFFDTLPADTFTIAGDAVTTTGIVTAVDTNGFYLQDPTGDGNDATSDALFVFTSSNPNVSVGDELEVSGNVAEFFPGDTDTRNLSITQMTNPTITTLSTDNALPNSTILGQGGRVPPSQTIDDDAFTSFDPETDGIDFFESVEGMLVKAQDAVAVSGTSDFGEIFTVVDGGADATGISDRNTLNISPDDFNPEKIQIDEDTGILPGFDLPEVDAGAVLGDVTGVVSYDFGNYQIQPTEAFSVTEPSTLTPETTELVGSDNQLTIATYNVLNLDPNDADGDTDVADGRFDAIAEQIVNHLGSPDIIGLQEVQDNSGSVDDGTIAADETLEELVAAIDRTDDGLENGSLVYEYVDNTFIEDGASGGQPGGNIRTAYLYNPERVDLVEDSVQTIGGQGEGEAFEGARLPLVATFDFNGEEITVVDNHFSSKGGSAPILGIEQPFDERQEDVAVNGSLDERQAQSEAVQEFVNGTLTEDPNANVVVLGDLNEFEFVSPVSDLEQNTDLTNLTKTLPEDERYSFIFQGNSQSLDHILVSDSLNATAEFDVVHTNSEFAETDRRASDHDPAVARFTFNNAASDAIWFSPKRDTAVGKAEDIVQFDDGGGFSTFFDGSTLGLDRVSIDAFDITSDNTILMSFDRSVTLAGLGRVDDSDVVQFTATSLGEGTTAGSFERYLDGSDLGLTRNTEDIDALTGLADGSVLFSTNGNARLSNGLRSKDEDLLRFDPDSGEVSLYFDGSDVGLTRGQEDIDAVGVRDDQLLFSTTGSFKVEGLTGRDEDVFGFTPASMGQDTSGRFASELAFDGSQVGFTHDLAAVDFSLGLA